VIFLQITAFSVNLRVTDVMISPSVNQAVWQQTRASRGCDPAAATFHGPV